MANIGTLTAHIGLNHMGLRGDMVRANASFTKFSSGAVRSLGKIGGAITSVSGALAGLGLAIGSVALLKSVDNIGTAFEQTMATVGGVMRATADELDALTDSARLMGEMTEFTASQAGESLRFLAMAGFDTNKAISALPGTLDLATAGNIDLGRAADIATNALTAMQLPVEELSRVNDVFIGTITRSNVNMEEMAEAFKFSAPLANAFGLSIEELAGLIGTLGNAGIKGSMAGTQLSMAIQKANDIAIRFGFSSSDLVDVLADLNREGRTSADIMDLFGIRAGRAALVLRDAIDPIRKFQNTLKAAGGEAKTLADVMRNTMNGAKKVMASVFESIKLDIFDNFRDDLLATIKSMTQWLRDNRDGIVAFAHGVVEAFILIKDTIVFAWDILAGFITAIMDGFKSMTEASSNASMKMEEDAKRMQDAMVPPELTEWEKFLDFNQRLGDTILNVFLFIVKSVGSLLATMIVDAIALFKGAIDTIWNFAAGFTSLLPFMPDRDDIDVEADIVNMLETWGKAGDDLAASWAKNWQDMKDDLFGAKKDISSALKDIVNDGKAFDKMFGMTSPEDFRKHLFGNEDFSKAVAESTIGGIDNAKANFNRLLNIQIATYRSMLSEAGRTTESMAGVWNDYMGVRLEQINLEAENLEKIGASAKFIADFVRKAMSDLDQEGGSLFGIDERLLNTQVSLYRDLLSESGRSINELGSLWSDYEKLRIEQIGNEAKNLEALGIASGTITKFVSKQFRDLQQEQRNSFEEQGRWLTDFTKGMAEELRYTMDEFFFKGLTEDFLKMTDFLEAIWTAFMRRISQLATDEFLGLIGLGTGGLSSFGSTSTSGGFDINAPAVPEFATGGIVTSPTLAMIGEVPEAVIPLSKLHNENFLKSMGVGGGDTNVVFHIQTPDPMAFKKSQSQIIAQVVTALRSAGRNT